jgi:hypothetical protein
MRIRAPFVALFTVLAPLASAEIYVVDDDGGPGVDFTDLPPAIAAVQSGDTLLVRAGVYSSFSTDKGITMLGQGNPTVPAILAVSLPPGLELAMRGVSSSNVRLENCSGTIFLEGASQLGRVEVASCVDVRLRGLMIAAPPETTALSIESASNVEIVQCKIYGGSGHYGGTNDGGDGATAVKAAAGSRVQIALTEIWGGYGGDCYSEWSTCYGGDGGHGILLSAGAELIVSGRPSDEIGGGSAGRNAFWDDSYGWDGVGLGNDGSTRYSGATIHGIVGGYVETPAVDDPILLADVQPGNLHVEMHGVPGGNARLLVGREPRVPFAGFLTKPLMLTQPRVLWLGVIDSSGVITADFSWTFPTLRAESFLLLLQGSVFDGGSTVRTNSAYLLSH